MKYDGATMPVQLEYILAGKGMWGREEQDEAGVDQRVVTGTESGHCSNTRWRCYPAERARKRREITPGEANDTDTATARCRGNSGDRIRPWDRWRLFRHVQSSV